MGWGRGVGGHSCVSVQRPKERERQKHSVRRAGREVPLDRRERQKEIQRDGETQEDVEGWRGAKKQRSTKM